MNGFIGRTLAAAGLAVGLSSLVGCYGYRDLVDPCYPWRYNWVAQQSVCDLRAAQVNNGHVLGQTLYDHHFERGSGKLTLAGMEKLTYITRCRPHPDPIIYLASAHDIAFNPDAPPNEFIEAREKLNHSRTESIQKYLAAEAAGKGVTYQVYVHNPDTPYIHSYPYMRAVGAMYDTGVSGPTTGAPGR